MADLELSEGRAPAGPFFPPRAVQTPFPVTGRRPTGEAPVVPPPPPPPEPPEKTLDPTLAQEYLEQTVEQLNRTMESVNARLSFNLYGEGKTLYVQVVNRRTQQVIRVMPPLEMLELREKINNAVGVVVDEIA